MLYKNTMNRMRQRPKFGIVLLSPLLLLLTSCTTTHISGLDRIFFPNSSAKVGPLVNADEQYPAEILVDPASKPIEELAGVSVNENELADNADNIVKEPESSEQTNAIAVTLDAKPKPITQSSDKNRDSKQEIEKTVTPVKIKQQKIALADVAKEKKPAPANVEFGTVSGQVVLISDGGQPLSAAGTLITLTPKKTTSEAQTQSPKTHVIDMANKEYQPQYSSINAGDQIVFVNKDNIQHNVFSPSGSNAFDLGTYGSGLKRAVTLTEPGIVKIYCNIHADMATFVAVGDSGLSVKADEQGRYKIDKLPLGTYDMTIWNIRGEINRTIEIKAQETLQLSDQIDTTVVKTETHKNKHGGTYSKNSALFKDEFY